MDWNCLEMRNEVVDFVSDVCMLRMMRLRYGVRLRVSLYDTLSVERASLSEVGKRRNVRREKRR